ncbi:MAG: YecR family lipoprotein [Bacteroidales bacterium]
MKPVFFFGVFFLFLVSCTAPKYLQIADGNRNDGKLTMVYTHGILEKPKVQWEEAREAANERCISWGYAGAKFFDVGLTDCVRFDSDGNCTRYRVTHNVECVYQDELSAMPERVESGVFPGITDPVAEISVAPDGSVWE